MDFEKIQIQYLDMCFVKCILEHKILVHTII